MMPVRRIVICECAGTGVAPEVARAALAAASGTGIPTEVVRDLCALAAARDPRLRTWTAAGGLRIAACHARAVAWLFAQAGAPLTPESTQLLNLRERGPGEPYLEVSTPELHPNALALLAQSSAAAAKIVPPVEPNHGSSWFPVIDYARCTGCMECLGFCLFGVFAVNATGELRVAHGELCKPGCPACSRVCPELAILFPKHPAAPINGGHPEGPGERVRVDISAALGGDVYAALRKRSAAASGQPSETSKGAGQRERFSVSRDADLALRERRRHLAELVGAGDIPAEVLANLPVVEELQQRAQEAAARARSGLQLRTASAEAMKGDV